MGKVAKKFPKTIKFIGVIGIVVGYLAMAFIFILLIKETILSKIKGREPIISPKKQVI